MSKKYVSFRIEKNVTTEKVRNQMYHDFRIHRPKNVDNDRIHLNRTLYQSEDFLAIKNKVKGVGKYAKAYQEFQDDKVKQITGRKLQKNTERFFTGISTFSPTMAEDYKSNPSLFNECALMFISRLEALRLKPLYVELHLDETTPHFHFTFDNIGDDGKSIRRNIKPRDLRDIQSLMGECFEPMGYERGESKETTLRKHLSVADFKEATKVSNDLAEQIKGLKTALMDLKNSDERLLHLCKLGTFEKLKDEGKAKALEMLEDKYKIPNTNNTRNTTPNTP